MSSDECRNGHSVPRRHPNHYRNVAGMQFFILDISHSSFPH